MARVLSVYTITDTNGAEESVLYILRGFLISGVEMYARVVVVVGKVVLFREVSSVQGCPLIEGFHCIPQIFESLAFVTTRYLSCGCSAQH